MLLLSIAKILGFVKGGAPRKQALIYRTKYWAVYDDHTSIAESANSRKVFRNIGADDLQAEYDRIKRLGIAAQMTESRCLRIVSPYWYFTFMDPDGNPTEITGRYKDQ